MKTIWILAIALFLGLTYISWKLTHRYFVKEHGEKLVNNWRSRLYTWQGAIFLGTAGTFIILFVLKEFDFLNF